MSLQSSFEKLAYEPPVYHGGLIRPGMLNQSLSARYQVLKGHPASNRTHLFHGRYENTYIPRQLIAEIEPVLHMASRYAEQILHLDIDSLKLGFWFNEMQPGHRTTLHSHDDDDELLSCVYYIQCPEDSGQLIIHDGRSQRAITPREGRIILFSPELPHEVSINNGEDMRLSVAINFGRTGD